MDLNHKDYPPNVAKRAAKAIAAGLDPNAPPVSTIGDKAQNMTGRNGGPKHWTKEQDAVLLEARRAAPTVSWNVIASTIKIGRSRTSCRHRYLKLVGNSAQDATLAL
eukprot:SAG11_NODE_404_length_9736_cov_20.243022_15_plen_107_part_00